LPNKKTDENRMNAQDICDALRRYLSESEDDRREIAAKIGISWSTLSAWLAGEAEHTNAFWHGWPVFLDVPDTSNVFALTWLRVSRGNPTK
jgi:hypothetical protein